MEIDKKKQGAANRRKGGVVERQIVNNHIAIGVEAKRVPLSGAARGYKGDVVIDVIGGLTAEAKSRQGGKSFSTLDKWLGQNDLLFVKRDRRPPLIVLPWTTYVRLIKATREGPGIAKAVPREEEEDEAPPVEDRHADEGGWFSR